MSSTALADAEPNEAVDDIEELCQRLPCEESPPAFSPTTMGLQLGVGVVATGATIGLGHGLFGLGVATGAEIFGWLSVGAFVLAPPMVSWGVPMTMGTSRGGYPNLVGTFVGGSAGLAPGLAFVIDRYGDDDRDILDIATRASAITGGAMLLGAILGYHIEDAVWDRPAKRLADVRLSPSLASTSQGSALLMGWSGRF